MKRLILKLAKQDSTFRKSLIQRLGAESHKPGEVWKTPGGFRAMNPKGVAKTFGSQEEAKEFSKGKKGKKKKEKRIDTGDPKGDKIIEDLSKLKKKYRELTESGDRKERDKIETQHREISRNLNSLPDSVQHRARDYMKMWGLYIT